MGTIKLGVAGALRSYVISARGDGIMWERGPASPFAAQVNTSNKYDKVDAWNEWSLEDWQGGVGRIDPEAGGFLYGEIETRVPNQMILPQAVSLCAQVSATHMDYSAWAYGPADSTAFSTVALGNTYLAAQVQTSVSGTIAVTGVYVLADAAKDTVIRADLYSDSGGSPDASLGNASLTVPARQFPGAIWMEIPLSIASIGTSTNDYWLVLRVTTGTATIYGDVSHPSGMVVKTSPTGSVWSSSTFRPFFGIALTYGGTGVPIAHTIVDVVPAPSFSPLWASLERSGGTDYTRLYGTYNAGEDYTYLGAASDSMAATPSSACVFNDYVVVGRGSASSLVVYDLPTKTGSTPTGDPPADLLYAFGGYCYRSVAGDLYYLGDSPDFNSTSWEGPIYVCSPPYEIRGMSVLNRDLYLGCDDGLYRLAPGSVVEGVAPWPVSSSNGAAMQTFGGSLYTTVNGRVWRFAPDGSFQDIWISRDADLVTGRLGPVVDLVAGDAFLLALVQESAATGQSSVWAYNDEGWHHVMTCPFGDATMMFYDRTRQRLYVGTAAGEACYMHVPEYACNPYNDADSLYMPTSWIEWDRFLGGQVLMTKCWESVTIIGDNISANRCIKAYWQDEGSTDWEYLGTATSDGHELRWTNFSTRPKGRWIKIGLLLVTNDPAETPRVRAVVVKFLPMVNDRLRDSLTVTLRDKIEFPDGTRDSYTRAQQWAHLYSASVIKNEDLVIYEDVFGDQWEVVVRDWGASVPEFAHYGDENRVDEMEVRLVLEQMPDTQYA